MWTKQLLPFLALAGFSYATRAEAQLDTSPPLQNVMLLVDTSGSMEFATDGTQVTCAQKDATLVNEPAAGTSQKSRWTQLVEVLTGDVTDYACYTQDRTSTNFNNEYKLGASNAADFNYHVPYHRILSGTSTANYCTIGAGVADTNTFYWGATPFKYHLWNAAGTSCTGFLQSSSGLLDTYRDRLRFGVMTFDTSTDEGVGLTGTSTPDYVTGTTGLWSYFLNWKSTPSCAANANCAKGKPAGCATSSSLEVGARNAAAPPWEGRMVPFGSTFAPITDVRNNNDHIQQLLTAARPFGATPINGLLSDARTFFRSDADNDYTTAGATCDVTTGAGCFGPRYDVLVSQGCRKNFIILLTDGEPNLDLRPYCEGTSGGYAGVCPYTDKTWEIVNDLKNPGAGIKPVTTYVIGFAVSSVDTGQPTPVDCSGISTKGTGGSADTFDPNGVCNPATMDPRLSACCTLAKIAFYGGTTNAFFASNVSQLRSAMASVLRAIAQTTSTRTMPVFASAQGTGQAYSFFSSFRSDPAALWQGVLERQRTKCVVDAASGSTVMVPTPQAIDATKGDEFADNVNAADATHPRKFYTVIADTDAAGKKWSQRSVRPAIAATNPDGITTLSGTTVNGGITDFFAPKVPALAMQVLKTACTELVPATDDACASVFMKWQIAATNASPYQSRTNALGAIYHSTPALVSVPNDFLRDESYSAFVDLMAKRPPVLYTATTDGQLHAFKVDKSFNDANDTFTIDAKVNNELWSFLPPAALPRMAAQYPDVEQRVLDGAPVVKDVVFVRSDADAKSGGAGALWHTVLVSGFGPGGPGYFALDITKPVVADGGPTFLWQLTTDVNGSRLFGLQSSTPAITTLFFGPSGAGGVGAQEYAVAILPGGTSAGPNGAAPGCDLVDPPAGLTSLVDSAWPPRSKVQCWANDPARSVTIVRLDTGEVIRSFRLAADGPASILPRSVNQLGQYTTLYAPISGRPVVFPATTGAVADRAFVGDRDGLIWRIDFSNPDPQKWTMRLFFDAYSKQAWNAGQPIETPPILSVDSLGNLTMAVSTGDQETFLSTSGMKNYLWSLLEQSTATPTFKSKALWYKLLSDGERVSGQMSLFASNLYYSTFTPPLATDPNKCSSGVSSVCGVHYMQARNIDPLTHLPVLDGSGGAVSVPSLNTATDPCLSFGQSIIFGAGITQRPTCNADATVSDPYLGNGSHTGLANFTPGKFDLVVQSGQNQITNPGSGAATATGAGTAIGGTTNTLAIELAPPMAPARIDSWAAVVE